MSDKLRFPFEGPIKGFVINHIKKNIWRLKGKVEVEDVMSDAHAMYIDHLDRYAGKVDTPQWFMALYKRSFVNYFHATSNYATSVEHIESLEALVHNTRSINGAEEDYSYCPHTYFLRGEDYNQGELELKIEQAPKEVAEVLTFLINNTEEEECWKMQGKKKNTGNQFICRALGKNPKDVDLVQLVTDYFMDN